MDGPQAIPTSYQRVLVPFGRREVNIGAVKEYRAVRLGMGNEDPEDLISDDGMKGEIQLQRNMTSKTARVVISPA
jgi:hypothetical protein